MAEFDFIPYLVTVGTIAGVIIAFYYQSRGRKDKVVENRLALQARVEETARHKAKEEELTRKELESSAKMLALDVKQDMKEHITQLVHTLKQDIELSRVTAYAKMDQIDNKIAQVKINLMDYIANQTDVNQRQQKSIEFLQTMAWGADAKSVPPWMEGLETTKEHEEEAEKGVFSIETKKEREEQTKQNKERIERERERE